MHKIRNKSRDIFLVPKEFAWSSSWLEKDSNKIQSLAHSLVTNLYMPATCAGKARPKSFLQHDLLIHRHVHNERMCKTGKHFLMHNIPLNSTFHLPRSKTTRSAPLLEVFWKVDREIGFFHSCLPEILGGGVGASHRSKRTVNHLKIFTERTAPSIYTTITITTILPLRKIWMDIHAINIPTRAAEARRCSKDWNLPAEADVCNSRGH